MPVEGAQVPGRIEARMALLAGCDPAAARAAELGLRGVIAGPEPLLAPGAALLTLAPAALVLSALKPAESGEGIVARVLNPTDADLHATLALGFPVAEARAVRLDEEPADHAVTLKGREVHFTVPAHALRSVWLRP
jgi:alpha-mannosidase